MAENPHALDLRRLRHLASAVAEGSLSAAALQLGLTQPALTASIKSLEADLGVALLERHRHGVQPTEQAEALLQHAQRAEQELAQAWQQIARLRRGQSQTLRVGCGPSEATRLLPQALLALRERRPDLRVVVEHGLNERLMPMVRAGEVDCALSSVPASTSLAELRHESLSTDVAVVVARPDHPLATRRAVGAADLAQFPWVLARRWELERKALDEMFARAGVRPIDASVETTSSTLMKSLVMHGDFLSFVPREMVHWEMQTGLLRALKVQGSAWERHLGLTVRRDRAPGEAVETLTECLRAVLRARR